MSEYSRNGMKCRVGALARGLGWFSIGLGLAEILAARKLGKFLGIKKDHELLIRMLGVREVASGIGILTCRHPTAWVWSRVGGDAIDLALLGASLSSDTAHLTRVAAATAAVAGVAAVDVFCGTELSRDGKATAGGAVHFERSVMINRAPEDLYGYWRDFGNLPKFMSHLVSVRVIDARRSHWIAKGPAGTMVEWDAEIITDKPNEAIAWRSLDCADVDHAGSVRFERAAKGRETRVCVKMQYRPFGGAVTAALTKVFGRSPERQVRLDLFRFKQVMETGEIARTEGQPAGRAKSTSLKYDDLVRF
ncbi:MAG: SRPBCC family protein [Verrucomicrobiota bacterium]